MGLKQTISVMLRKAGLIRQADNVRYLAHKLRNTSSNRAFKKNSMEVIPPDRLMYEIFGTVNYKTYFNSGESTAKALIKIITDYVDFEESTICEWGCGTGRVISHFPKLLEDKDIRYYASDVNEKMIDWCREHIVDVEFYTNGLYPPLVFDDNSIDVVFSTSVFNHLSDEQQFRWLNEIYRILSPGGIFIFTTQGDFQASKKLTKQELDTYQDKNIVIRANTSLGSRTYSIFQGEFYTRDVLLSGSNIIAHLKDIEIGDNDILDLWIIKK